MWTSGVIGSARPSSHGAVAVIGRRRRTRRDPTGAGGVRRRRGRSGDDVDAVVTDERAVLDVAEISTDRPRSTVVDRRRGSRSVEAAGVHDPGVLHGLVTYRAPISVSHSATALPATICCDDEVRPDSVPSSARPRRDERHPRFPVRSDQGSNDSCRIPDVPQRRPVAARPVRIVTFASATAARRSTHSKVVRRRRSSTRAVLVAVRARTPFGGTPSPKRVVGGALGEQCLEDAG